MKRILYTQFINYTITLNDIKPDINELDIIIISSELNIPSINKNAVCELSQYILKNHLIQYETDKANILQLINNKSQSENIINNANNSLQYSELKTEIEDLKQWIGIINKRSLWKSTSEKN